LIDELATPTSNMIEIDASDLFQGTLIIEHNVPNASGACSSDEMYGPGGGMYGSTGELYGPNEWILPDPLQAIPAAASPPMLMPTSQAAILPLPVGVASPEELANDSVIAF
jgi:hypothetical protein